MAIIGVSSDRPMCARSASGERSPTGLPDTNATDHNRLTETSMTRKNDAGQALIFTVVALGILLMGFAGLGIDMGYLRYEKRLQQSAADTAAIAGASNLLFLGVTPGAQNAATANGFTDGSGNTLSTCTGNDSHSDALVGKICVQVSNPPSTGPHSSDFVTCGPSRSCYVEVYVSEVQPTFFMRVLGIKSETVTARGVATYVGGGKGSGCLYTLKKPSDAPSPEGITLIGNSELDAPGCGIIDNGDYNPGGNTTLNSATFGVFGTVGNNGTTNCSGSSTCPALNMPTAGDPLAGLLTPPTVGTPINFPANPVTNPPVPGSTYNGISIPANTTVTFPAGLYIVTGGNFTVGSNSQVRGTGVTFYFTNGATIDASAGGNTLDIKFSAPTSGQYAGVLFYQDPADTSGPQLGGDNNTFFQGTLYFPSAQMTFFGNDTFNSGAAYSIVIAGSIAANGPTVTLSSDFSSLPGGVSIIKNAVLVE